MCAADLPGAKKVLPQAWRSNKFFDNIYQLDCVPIATVQVRFDGWVTEMQSVERMLDVSGDQSDGRGGFSEDALNGKSDEQIVSEQAEAVEAKVKEINARIGTNEQLTQADGPLL